MERKKLSESEKAAKIAEHLPTGCRAIAKPENWISRFSDEVVTKRESKGDVQMIFEDEDGEIFEWWIVEE